MQVPMLDLKKQYAQIRDEVDAAVQEVFESQCFRGGPKVEAFESAIAAYTGVRHAIGVASGTDALLLLFRALGIEPGDEIITTPFTFFATAGAIVNAGAKPVFCDIDPVTFCIDPKGIETCVTERTRAIAPVHLYGQCADMDTIMGISESRGIPVIEDAAQAIGAQYKGRPACGLGRGAALSFYPTKNLGAAGEGGMITTDDDDLAEQVRLLRCHGSSVTYHHAAVGTNSHLHAIQAAVLGVKLGYLDGWNERRRQIAAFYDKEFGSVADMVTPVVADGNTHVYHQYVVRVPNRDAVRDALQEQGIGCGVFYPVPLHLQECFAYLGYTEGTCPVAEQASREVLALPIHPDLTEEQQATVVSRVREAVDKG